MRAPEEAGKMQAHRGPHWPHPSVTRTPNKDCWDSAGTGGGGSWPTDTSKQGSCKQLCPAPPSLGGSAPVLHLDTSVHEVMTFVFLPWEQ